MKKRIAECINILGEFCGKRDIPALTSEQLESKYGINQADIMVLFGGSILCGGDVFANAIQNKVAKKYIIVGGAGHTTEALRMRMRSEFPTIETSELPEAKIFASYLEFRYGLHADLLECKSTNCGNNITFLLDLLKKHRVPYQSIILAQDATMQRRMEAGLRKYALDITIINYAVYAAKIIIENSELIFEKEIWGMWDVETYISLLMGEISRLSDNTEGYGPKGKNFIDHVDIPIEVEDAFQKLKKEYAGMVRGANPLYASAKPKAISQEK